MADVLRSKRVLSGDYAPKAVYEGTEFYDADVFVSGTNSSFQNCYFNNCTFHDMEGAEVADCHMDQCRFEDADLSDCVFRDTLLNDTVIAGSVFSADNADFENVRFLGEQVGNMGLTIDPSVKDVSFSGCGFSDSIIDGVRTYRNRHIAQNIDFSDASFSHTDLARLSFVPSSRVDMTNVQMDACAVEVMGDFDPVINGFFRADNCAFIVDSGGSAFAKALKEKGNLIGFIMEDHDGTNRHMGAREYPGLTESILSRFRNDYMSDEQGYIKRHVPEYYVPEFPKDHSTAMMESWWTEGNGDRTRYAGIFEENVRLTSERMSKEYGVLSERDRILFEHLLSDGKQLGCSMEKAFDWAAGRISRDEVVELVVGHLDIDERTHLYGFIRDSVACGMDPATLAFRLQQYDDGFSSEADGYFPNKHFDLAEHLAACDVSKQLAGSGSVQDVLQMMKDSSVYRPDDKGPSILQERIITPLKRRPGIQPKKSSGKGWQQSPSERLLMEAEGLADDGTDKDAVWA